MSQADADRIKIFPGRASVQLAQAMCDVLELPMGVGTTEIFPDGELLVKIDEDVRGRDCFVVQSTSNPVNAHLMELLIYIDCLRRASAQRITAVIPYFGYARQDRKDEGRRPITAKLVANLITAAGADRVLAMDLHAAQIQGFFDIPVDHLSASPVLLGHIQKQRAGFDPLCVVSPDPGNVKVAGKVAAALDADFAIIDKRRKSGTVVESANIIGDVGGKNILMVDDMISTAGTVCAAAELVKKNGAKTITVASTHAVMVGPALERIAASPIDHVIVTDSIPGDDRLTPIDQKLTVLSVAHLLGTAVHNIHHNLSISSLFNQGDADGASR